MVDKLEHKIEVLEQTRSELEDKMEELQRWHNVTLGREERVLELKAEVNDLLSLLGKPKKYLNK